MRFETKVMAALVMVPVQTQPTRHTSTKVRHSGLGATKLVHPVAADHQIWLHHNLPKLASLHSALSVLRRNVLATGASHARNSVRAT